MPRALRRPRTEVEAILGRVVESGAHLWEEPDVGQKGFEWEDWDDRLSRWTDVATEALEASYLLAPDDDLVGEFRSILFLQSQPYAPGQDEFAGRRDALKRGLNMLRSLLDGLAWAEEPLPPPMSVSAVEEPGDPPDPDTAARDISSEAVQKQGAGGRGIFLVHGQDEARTLAVARFLDRVTEPGATVLREQPEQGNTIIEKFERYASDAGYAVVLLTGDDEGRQRATDDALVARARQNVILELGFFVGVLGRSRVTLLYETEVELPSDISGVVYLKLDDGGAWKTKLANEMRQAGVQIDLDAVLES